MTQGAHGVAFIDKHFANRDADRFTSKGKRPTGRHVFDVSCAEMEIEHRLSQSLHPVERVLGAKMAAAAARQMEYSWKPFVPAL